MVVKRDDSLVFGVGIQGVAAAAADADKLAKSVVNLSKTLENLKKSAGNVKMPDWYQNQSMRMPYRGRFGSTAGVPIASSAGMDVWMAKQFEAERVARARERFRNSPNYLREINAKSAAVGTGYSKIPMSRLNEIMQPPSLSLSPHAVSAVAKHGKLYSWLAASGGAPGMRPSLQKYLGMSSQERQQKISDAQFLNTLKVATRSGGANLNQADVMSALNPQMWISGVPGASRFSKLMTSGMVGVPPPRKPIYGWASGAGGGGAAVSGMAAPPLPPGGFGGFGNFLGRISQLSSALFRVAAVSYLVKRAFDEFIIRPVKLVGNTLLQQSVAILKASDEWQKIRVAGASIYGMESSKKFIPWAWRAASVSIGQPKEYMSALQQYGTTIPELRGSLRRGDIGTANRLVGASQRLKALFPQYTFEQATAAIVAAMAGNWQRMQRTFKLRKEIIEKESGIPAMGGMQTFAGIEKFLKARVSDSAIFEIGATAGEQWENVISNIERFRYLIGDQGFYDKVRYQLLGINKAINELVSSDKTTAVFKRISNYLSSLVDDASAAIKRIIKDLDLLNSSPVTIIITILKRVVEEAGGAVSKGVGGGIAGFLKDLRKSDSDVANILGMAGQVVVGLVGSAGKSAVGAWNAFWAESTDASRRTAEADYLISRDERTKQRAGRLGVKYAAESSNAYAQGSTFMNFLADWIFRGDLTTAVDNAIARKAKDTYAVDLSEFNNSKRAMETRNAVEQKNALTRQLIEKGYSPVDAENIARGHVGKSLGVQTNVDTRPQRVDALYVGSVKVAGDQLSSIFGGL